MARHNSRTGDAVMIAPVSRQNSLQTGNFAGNLANLAARKRFRSAETAAVQWVSAHFPAPTSREFYSRNRVSSGRNREMFASIDFAYRRPLCEEIKGPVGLHVDVIVSHERLRAISGPRVRPTGCSSTARFPAKPLAFDFLAAHSNDADGLAARAFASPSSLEVPGRPTLPSRTRVGKVPTGAWPAHIGGDLSPSCDASLFLEATALRTSMAFKFTQTT